jgi:hypothetical protein
MTVRALHKFWYDFTGGWWFVWLVLGGLFFLLFDGHPLICGLIAGCIITGSFVHYNKPG